MSRSRRPVFLTVRRAAWLLHVDPSTISRAIRLGTLRTVRRSGRRVIPVSEVVRLLSEPTGSAPQNGGRQ